MRGKAFALAGETEDQLLMPGKFGDHGRAPGTEPFLGVVAELPARLIVLPDLVAGFLVQRDQELSFARPAPKDDVIAVQDWRRGIAPDVELLAQVAVPELLAVQVEADQPRRAKAGVHALAIGRRRAAA